MDQTKINIDYCGIQNLLRILEQHGFSKEDLRPDRRTDGRGHYSQKQKTGGIASRLLCIFSRILREKLWQVFFSLWVAIKSKVW